jgi:enoyl-CoA hydratase
MSMTNPMVTLDRFANGVAQLTLNNPPLNLNTLSTIHELSVHCAMIAADASIRVVIITGSGEKAFCAGSDLNEFSAVRDAVVEKKLANENRAFTAIENLPQPVIAALNGVTLGGGLEIALACDLRILDERAVIGVPEINLGVFPGGGGVFRLPRIVGQGRALELLFTGEPIDAHEALRIGLVNRVAPQGGSLELALQLGDRLSAKPSLALSLIKEGVHHSFLETTADATARTLMDSDLVFTGPDIEEGVDAFFQKRMPHFTAGRHDRPMAQGEPE